MAARKSSNKSSDREPGVAPAVSDAEDGGDSRLTKGYEDNPDVPDKTTIAQVEVLKDETPDEG